MWGLPPAGSPFGALQGLWSLPLLSRVMGTIALSLEQLLQLWIFSFGSPNLLRAQIFPSLVGVLGFVQLLLCLWIRRAHGARSEARGHWED